MRMIRLCFDAELVKDTDYYNRIILGAWSIYELTQENVKMTIDREEMGNVEN